MHEETSQEEERSEAVGEREVAGNCRDCRNWNLKDMAKMKKKQAMQGYGKCNNRAGLLPMAGWSCAKWSQAEEKSIQARREFLGGWL